jgi:hypothetical protein
MNHRMLAAVLAWIDLSPQEREEVNSIVRTWDKSDNRKREEMGRKIGDALASIDLGPLTKPCSACGR